MESLELFDVVLGTDKGAPGVRIEIRRGKLNHDNLVFALREKFGQSLPESPVIKYDDGENLVTISNDEELDTAVCSVIGDKTLKLFIIDNKSTESNAITQSFKVSSDTTGYQPQLFQSNDDFLSDINISNTSPLQTGFQDPNHINIEQQQEQLHPESQCQEQPKPQEQIAKLQEQAQINKAQENTAEQQSTEHDVPVNAESTTPSSSTTTTTTTTVYNCDEPAKIPEKPETNDDNIELEPLLLILSKQPRSTLGKFPDEFRQLLLSKHEDDTLEASFVAAQKCNAVPFLCRLTQKTIYFAMCGHSNDKLFEFLKNEFTNFLAQSTPTTSDPTASVPKEPEPDIKNFELKKPVESPQEEEKPSPSVDSNVAVPPVAVQPTSQSAAPETPEPVTTKVQVPAPSVTTPPPITTTQPSPTTQTASTLLAHAIDVAHVEEPKSPYSVTFITHTTLEPGVKVLPGQQRVKLWLVKNSGTIAWPKGCKLVYFEGQNPGASSPKLAIPCALPGTEVNIASSITTPAEIGNYTTKWRIVDNNNLPFGELETSYTVTDQAPNIQPKLPLNASVPIGKTVASSGTFNCLPKSTLPGTPANYVSNSFSPSSPQSYPQPYGMHNLQSNYGFNNTQPQIQQTPMLAQPSPAKTHPPQNQFLPPNYYTAGFTPQPYGVQQYYNNLSAIPTREGRIAYLMNLGYANWGAAEMAVNEFESHLRGQQNKS